MSIITTDRVILRYFDKSMDENAFFTYRNDPKISIYQGWSKPYTREHVEDFFNQMRGREISTTGSWIQIACELKTTGEMIGDCAFNNRDGTAEIGITIRSEFHRQGFAKEILQALFDILFNKIGVHRIIAHLDVDNIASMKLMKSLNMRKEGHFIKSFWDKYLQEYRDEFLYAFLEEEYFNS